MFHVTNPMSDTLAMSLRVWVLCLLLSLATATYGEKVSLIGATLINPADGKVLPNATVVIDGNKIERVAMGKQDAATLGRQVSCVGKFILPGYIDRSEEHTSEL